MAWGSQGMVFLGEDLLHSRDYSEDTARVVDSEVSRILRVQEERAIELLSRHRGGLDAVARGLLERETLDGDEVAKLVDTAYGRPVHDGGAKVPHFAPSDTSDGNVLPPPRALDAGGVPESQKGDGGALSPPAPVDSGSPGAKDPNGSDGTENGPNGNVAEPAGGLVAEPEASGTSTHQHQS